jgi:hypothetical protein
MSLMPHDRVGALTDAERHPAATVIGEPGLHRGCGESEKRLGLFVLGEDLDLEPCAV